MKKITFVKNSKNFSIEFIEGQNLLEIIREHDFDIDATCGGRGTCGKCTVEINEKMVKSCTTTAIDGMIVKFSDISEINNILTETEKLDIKVKPIFSTIVEGYGLAVDIGTTTIAAYLYDIHTGERLMVKSSINPQKIFGADVISRIDYTRKGEVERLKMHTEIVECIQMIIDDLPYPLSILMFTGNTTMMHFLLDLDASGIAVAPFTPESTDLHMLKAKEIGFNKNAANATMVVLPCVSAYVGADTVSAVIATGLDTAEKPELLVDIGTNGEIALKTPDGIWACSTAAGPAFEGANITFGMPAVEGAISKAWIENDQLRFKTIGDCEPKGLCGSGVLDLIALMLETEVVDCTGRLVDDDELSQDWLKKRIVEYNNANAFKIVGDILVTQKDVREIQNAKAAICAGITILATRAGVELTDIFATHLAGGFGNFMDRKSAVKIGLIPCELEASCKTSGNAAGLGASMALLNQDNLNQVISLSKTIKYIELSYDPDFVNSYVDNMMFGDE